MSLEQERTQIIPDSIMFESQNEQYSDKEGWSVGVGESCFRNIVHIQYFHCLKYVIVRNLSLYRTFW